MYFDQRFLKLLSGIIGKFLKLVQLSMGLGRLSKTPSFMKSFCNNLKNEIKTSDNFCFVTINDQSLIKIPSSFSFMVLGLVLSYTTLDLRCNNILGISIFTGHTSLHAPHKLDANGKSLDSCRFVSIEVPLEPIGPDY